MASQGAEGSNDRLSPWRQKSRSSYATLIRQSRELGGTAIKTLLSVRSSTKQILNQRGVQLSRTRDDVDNLKQAVAHSREVLATAKTVLPFVFPHEIILDRSKITIIKRNFFWSADVISIRVEDILSVSTCVGPFFGSITFASRVMSSVDHFTIDRFWRGDIIELKQITQGYLIARQSGLETDHLDRDELAETFRELGRDI